ncbi:MAG: hypothetical protein DI536_06475 [Archangium gephyra]|uniref:Delta-60 repeat protein n=1 Tax=Archangium gephyra TaxID=48 RepID=A0A2W5TQ89_9BACT|nr:MAG: hypothetical protein DI536_06475 [Archangium gephyra]
MRAFVLGVLVMISSCNCPGPAVEDDAGSSVETDAGTEPERDAGTARTNVSGVANAIVAQGDRFVLVGSTGLRPDVFQLARMHGDGSLDETFGTNGYAFVEWPSFFWSNPMYADAGVPPVELSMDVAFAATLQGSKIVVSGSVGSRAGQNGAFGIARFSADGVLDQTFGDGGTTDVRFSSFVGGTALSLAQRADGKLYIGGFTTRSFDSANDTDFAVARFTADGVLDDAFGFHGVEVIDFGREESGRSLAFQGDKVLIAGGDDFSVTRLNPDGNVDVTFGSGGVARSQGGYAHNMRVLTSGHILVAGSISRGDSLPWAIKLVRYTADGQLDATFGVFGEMKLGFDEQQVAVLSLDELPGGEIVLAMVSTAGATPRPTVARLSANGTLDSSFGTNGLTALPTQLTYIGGNPFSPNQAIVSGGKLHLVDSYRADEVYVRYVSTSL